MNLKAEKRSRYIQITTIGYQLKSVMYFLDIKKTFLPLNDNDKKQGDAGNQHFNFSNKFTHQF